MQRSRTLFGAACALALLSSACGADAGFADSAESASQELTACLPQIQPVVLATASTQQAAAFAPKFAIDGNGSTRWSSNKAPEQSLVLDLGKVVNVSGININWQTAYSKSFNVESSDDGLTNWNAFLFSGATRAGLQSLTGFARTRYLRIRSKEATSWGNVSIIDLQVLGTVDATCSNLLSGPWALSKEDIDPPSFNVENLYEVSGNTIVFTYVGPGFTINGSDNAAGLHFKQPVPVVQGGRYRLRLDVTNLTGASTTIFHGRLSGAPVPAEPAFADGNGSTVIDFEVTAAPGASPTVELISTPIMVFPGAAVQDFTVTPR